MLISEENVNANQQSDESHGLLAYGHDSEWPVQVFRNFQMPFSPGDVPRHTEPQNFGEKMKTRKITSEIWKKSENKIC